MEENYDDPELDDYTRKKIKKEIEDNLEEKKLTKQWRSELEANDSFQSYLSGFKTNTVEVFLDMYLRRKYQAYKHKIFYAEQLEKMRTQWIDEANEHLEPILQKKLYDMQCLWRANKLTIEGVEISFDFKLWGNDILNCPFLELTTDDIELYQDFLKSGEADLYCNSFHDWQDYDDLKKAYAGDSDFEMPEWYEYHNMRTGNGPLSLLSDVREPKERFYIDIANENDEKKKAKIHSSPYVPDDRPFLWYSDDETVTFIVNTFEDAESKKNMQNYLQYKKTSDFDLDRLIMDMSEIDDYIPIESHYDYKQALEIAYNKYFLGKVSEHLPIAYEQYLFNKSMNLDNAKEKFHDSYVNIRNDYYKSILDGRELNGEPRDLNF